MTRINSGAGPVGRLIGAYGEKARAKGPGEAGKPAAARADKVELSPQAQRAQEVRRLQEQLQAAGDGVRLEKVEALRQAIDAGTYQPEAWAVAEKMLKQRALE